MESVLDDFCLIYLTFVVSYINEPASTRKVDFPSSANIDLRRWKRNKALGRGASMKKRAIAATAKEIEKRFGIKPTTAASEKPLLDSGYLLNYLSDQMFSKKSLLDKTSTTRKRIVGIFSDYGQGNQVHGLKKIHWGGYQRGGKVGTPTGNLMGKWIPPRPFLLAPQTFYKKEMIDLIKFSFANKISGLHLKQDVKT